MSQHHFATQYQGRPVTVVLGWDRPLQGFFMVIEDTSDRSGYLYSNLDDDALLWCNGLPPTLEHFETQLAQLDVNVPQTILQAVEFDGVFNTGSFIARYDAEGQRIV